MAVYEDWNPQVALKVCSLTNKSMTLDRLAEKEIGTSTEYVETSAGSIFWPTHA